MTPNTILYYAAGKASTAQATPKLPHAFTRQPEGRQSSGPDGKTGIVFAEAPTSGIVFAPDKQTWHPFPGLDGYWFGWWNETPPQPRELTVPQTLPGHAVTLAGREWVIPVAKRFDSVLSDADGAPRVAGCLPRALTWNGEQFVTGDIVPRYERLWEISEVIFDLWRTSEGDSLQLPPNAEMLCCELIAANYRLSPAEICGMGLLESDANHLWSILRCVIDLPTLLDWVKKKGTAVGASTSPGEAA